MTLNIGLHSVFFVTFITWDLTKVFASFFVKSVYDLITNGQNKVFLLSLFYLLFYFFLFLNLLKNLFIFEVLNKFMFLRDF